MPLATGLALTAAALSADAQDSKVRFTLDRKMQGLRAWFYLTQDKGCSKAGKVDMTIDRDDVDDKWSLSCCCRCGTSPAWLRSSQSRAAIFDLRFLAGVSLTARFGGRNSGVPTSGCAAFPVDA